MAPPSPQPVHRLAIATYADIFTIRNAFIRHFGGVTVLHQPPAPAFGVGARDPAKVSGTPEVEPILMAAMKQLLGSKK